MAASWLGLLNINLTVEFLHFRAVMGLRDFRVSWENE